MMIPSVQTFAARKGVEWVNQEFNVNIQLQRLQYQFPNRFELQGILIEDYRGDTLIAAEGIDLFFNGRNSFTNTVFSAGVELVNPNVRLYTYPGDSLSNLQHFSQKLSASPDTSEKRKTFGLEINKIQITNGKFWLEDANCSGCYKMRWRDLNGFFRDFDLQGEYLTIYSDSLRGKDLYGLELKDLKGQIAYLSDEISVQEMHLQTVRSKLRGEIALRYDSMAVFDDFVNKVKLNGDFDSSVVHSADIAVFASEVPRFGEAFVDGRVDGIVNFLESDDIQLKLGKASSFRGPFSIQNVASSEEDIFIASSSFAFRTNELDLQQLQHVFLDTMLLNAQGIDNVRLSGAYNGTFESFDADITLESGWGKLLAKGWLKNASSKTGVSYNLQASSSSGVDLGEFLNTDALGASRFDISLQGRGYDPARMSSKIAGSVQKLTLNDYAYQKINLNGNIDTGRFVGNVNIDDPNLKLLFDGEASFENKPYSYNFSANIDHVDFHQLGFTNDSVAELSTRLGMRLKARDINSLTGRVVFDSTFYQSVNKAYNVGRIALDVSGLDSLKSLELSSNVVDASFDGSYTWAGMAQSFVTHFDEYIHPEQDLQALKDQRFDFSLVFKNSSLLTDLTLPNLDIASQTALRGSYFGKRNDLTFQLQSTGIQYQKDEARNISINYNGGGPNSFVALDVGKIVLANGKEIDSLFLGNFIYNDTLNYLLTAVMRDSIDSYFNLRGYAMQEDTNQYALSLDQSRFNIGAKDFSVPDGSKITVDSSGIHVRDLWLQSDSAYITVNGAINQNRNEILRVSLHRMDLELLNYILAQPAARFNGMAEGSVIMSEITGPDPKLATDVTIDSLRLNAVPLGDLTLFSNWSIKDSSIFVDVHSDLGKLRMLEAKGVYRPKASQNFDLDLNFNKFRITALEPFMTGILENLRGYLNADISLRGSVEKPILNGTANMPKLGFTVSMLQTDYNFTEDPTIRFSENSIELDSLKLRDTKYLTSGLVSGNIGHQYFSDFDIDMKISSDKILVLNTKFQPNDLYYGRAFVGGNINFTGPLERIFIQADVATKGNSDFNLPLSGATEVGQSDFIKFVDPTEVDTTTTEEELAPADVAVLLDFDIAVDEQTSVNIILDEETDNELKARGTGNIKLKMNAEQDLELFGKYGVVEGEYNFNLEGYFNRNFQVLRGGTVSWNGDPYDARMDLQALYSTRANPALLISNYNGGPTLVEVYLNIQGSLTAPDIAFDIKTPRISSSYQTVLNGRLADENSRNQQVFSLLALNSFTPAGGITESTGSGLNQWDILTNQASSWLNKITGDYEITLNYQPGTTQNGETTTQANDEEFEVGVSKKLFDNRFSINGVVGVPLNDNTNAVAGDFEIQYDITPDGRISAKGFSRAIQNDYSLAADQFYRHGVGLNYKIDFVNYGDLVRLIFNANDKGRKEEEEER